MGEGCKDGRQRVHQTADRPSSLHLVKHVKSNYAPSKMAGKRLKNIEETWPLSSSQEIYNFSWHQYILLNITDSCAIYLPIILNYEFFDYEDFLYLQIQFKHLLTVTMSQGIF